MSDTPDKPESAPEPAPEERMALPSWSRSRTKKRGDGGQAAPPKDDAFQTAVRSAGRAASNRGRWVVLGLVAVALAIGGAVIFRAKGQSNSSQATKLLATAAALEARGRVGDVESLAGPTAAPPYPIVPDEAARAAGIAKALADLDENAGSSGPAQAAQLLRGAELLRAGKFSEAEAAYREIIHVDDHPLGFMAREGVALALEGQGDIDGALSQLEILAGDKGAMYREAALYHRARIFAANDRKEEAVATLRSYIEEYPLREFSLMGDDVRKLVEVVEPTLLADAAPSPSAVDIVDNAAQAPAPPAE
ncbi:MAG: tetratricopeptide repeat protein [Nannocystaceae bacterium]